MVGMRLQQSTQKRIAEMYKSFIDTDIKMSTCMLSSSLTLFVCFVVLPSLLHSTIYLSILSKGVWEFTHAGPISVA